MARIEDWNLPEDIAEHVDFISNSLLVVLGYVSRRFGIIRDEHLPGMTKLAFGFCLPALVVGILWSATIDSIVLVVAPVSLIVSTITTLLVSGGVRLFCSLENRGFYSMAVTANAMAYVYPVVLRREAFGDTSAAVVLMWELGGNLWVAIVYYGLMSNMYKPVAQLEPGKDQSVHGSGLEKEEVDVAVEFPEVSQAAAVETCKAGAGVWSADEPPSAELACASVASRLRPQILGSAASSTSAAECSSPSKHRRASFFRQTPENVGENELSLKDKILQIVGPVVKVPLLWGAVVGLLLNMSTLPVYPIPGKALNSIASAFPVLLYLLLGANLKFSLGGNYGLVAKSLLARWSLNAVAASGVYYMLPFDQRTRGTLVLCLTAPIATTFILYTSQHGYAKDVASMTFNLSSIASLVVLNSLADRVAA